MIKTALLQMLKQGHAFGWCPNGTQCPLSHDTDLIILQDEKHVDTKRKKRKRQKKRDREDAAEGSSIFDGAPENKKSHMEVDQEETDDQQKATPDLCPENVPPVDSNGNTEQGEGEKMNTESKGNGVCEDNADSRNSVKIAPTDETKMKTNTDDSVERSTADRGQEKVIDHSTGTDVQKKKAESGTHRAGFDAFMTGYIFAYSHTFVKNKEAAAVKEDCKEDEQLWLPSCRNKVYLSGKEAALNVVKSTFAKSSKAHVQKMEVVWGGRK